MKWSWRIARVSGIEVYLHGTFLILLAWVALRHFLQGHGVTDAMAGLFFVSTLFGIVVLHERPTVMLGLFEVPQLGPLAEDVERTVRAIVDRAAQ